MSRATFPTFGEAGLPRATPEPPNESFLNLTEA